MSDPIRILHVLGNTDLGGAESRTMDIYRHIDRTKVQFDFIRHTNRKCHFDEEIIQLGGRLFDVPRFKLYNITQYRRAWKNFLVEHKEYKTLHIQMTSTASLYIRIAKKLGVEKIIAHARSAGVDKGIKGIITRVLRINLWKQADICLACSELAGEAVFGKRAMNEKKVQFIPDALEISKYVYNPTIREEIRNKYNLDNKFVIGHLGRFHYAKNHFFLLKIFKEIALIRKDAILLLVGDGELMSSVKEEAERLMLMDKIIFTGMQKNSQDYYQAMDYFLFPSRYEGLPGSVIEAQISGLQCLISDRITSQVKITELVQTESLETEPIKWAEKLVHTKQLPRSSYDVQIRLAGYDIKEQAEKIQQSYLTGMW